MTGFTILASLLLAASPSVQETSYSKAYAAHKKTGCPLVVLVTADWCPACQQMKNSAIPTAIRNGAFKKVVFTTVNVDENRALANQIMSGGSIPQLVMFYKTDKGSQRLEIIGGTSSGAIAQFVNRGLVQPAARITKRDKSK